MSERTPERPAASVVDCAECGEPMGVETSTRNGRPCHIRCPRDYPGPVGDALRQLRDEQIAALRPGSDEAHDAGCICPRMDNGYGRGYLGGATDPATGETLFVSFTDCPLHGSEADRGVSA